MNAPRTRPWDLLVRGGKVFDGTGGAPQLCDVAIVSGRVVTMQPGLNPEDADRVIDASGCWVTPGLLDVHTHYDLEVELDPGLPESVRHGTTTVVIANCSLGLAFGNQRHTGSDPVVSCFARVENIPKGVLSFAADVATWRHPADYLAHLDSLPLGPSVVPLLPHSMLRIEVMGVEGSVTRDPTPAELDDMADRLRGALGDGYAGLSTDGLPFHYLANDPHRKVKIPTQHASFAELRRLTDEVRKMGRVWQTTPPKDNPLKSLRNFLLSSGRLFGAPLKVTAVAAMAVVPNRSLLPMAGLVSSLLNSPLLQGHFYMQSLAARFKVWADGPITPLSEEIDVLRELNEPDLEDRAARQAILDDPAWQARFSAWWWAGKQGFGLAWLKRWLGMEDSQLSRRLEDMVLDGGPMPMWSGLTLAAVHQRLCAWQADPELRVTPAEEAVFGEAPSMPDEAQFLIWLLRTFDTALCWWCISANPDEATVGRILKDERFLPGFNDSGAHLTNMAFYDANLRGLRHAMVDGDAGVARMVYRLTRLPAALFGVDAGRLEPGAVADLVVINPTALASWDSEANTRLEHRAAFGQAQRVNRSEGVVRKVVIAGEIAWDERGRTAALGNVQLGRCLRATSRTPAEARS